MKVRKLLILPIVAIVLTLFVTQTKSFEKNASKPQPLAYEVNQLAPHYKDYSPEALRLGQSEGRVVLFFAANWCGDCSALDDDLKKKSVSLPPDVTVLKVNYDNEKELKRKYQVIRQTALVLLDKNNNEVKKWYGGTVDTILQQLH